MALTVLYRKWECMCHKVTSMMKNTGSVYFSPHRIFAFDLSLTTKLLMGQVVGRSLPDRLMVRL